MYRVRASSPPSAATWILMFAPGALALGVGILSYLAAGPTLGLFLGSMFLLTLLAPPLVLAQAGTIGELVAACGMVAGISLVWAVGASRDDISAFDYLRCVAVMGSYLAALFGAVHVLRRNAGVILTPAIVTVIAFAWLAWPIWLSPWIGRLGGDRTAAFLTSAHALFALNSVVTQLGTWEHFPLMYHQLTNLNQDVPYRLPGSIVPAVALHALGGIGCWLAGTFLNRRKRQMPDNSIESVGDETSE